MDERIQEIIFYYQDQPYQSQATRTYEMLLEMIALEALPEKRTYTVIELQEMLQIGRTPLRDALRLLEFDSIIKTIPRVGIQVQQCQMEDYFLQAEARLALEKVIIRRSCVLATDSFRIRLGRLNDDFRTLSNGGNSLALYRVDRNIHKLIDECSKNSYAVHALGPLRFYEQRIHYHLSSIYPDIGDVLNQEHIAFVDGIIAGDEEIACAHFKKMIDNTVKLVQIQVKTHLEVPFYNEFEYEHKGE